MTLFMSSIVTGFFSWLTIPLAASAALLLSGCWTPPTASIGPKGEPRVIENAIEVESLTPLSMVASVDSAARTRQLGHSIESGPCFSQLSSQ